MPLKKIASATPAPTTLTGAQTTGWLNLVDQDGVVGESGSDSYGRMAPGTYLTVGHATADGVRLNIRPGKAGNRGDYFDVSTTLAPIAIVEVTASDRIIVDAQQDAASARVIFIPL